MSELRSQSVHQAVVMAEVKRMAIYKPTPEQIKHGCEMALRNRKIRKTPNGTIDKRLLARHKGKYQHLCKHPSKVFGLREYASTSTPEGPAFTLLG
jgi:hypothetical protein